MTMKPDRKDFNELFTLLREKWAVEVRTIIPGIVKGYAVVKGRPVCDVQLGPRQILADLTDDELPLVERVPIGYLVMGSITIRAQLEVGQGVLCHVSDRQLNKFLTEGRSTYRPGIGSIHDENDIIASPTLQPNAKEPTVSMNPSELYIGDHSGAATFLRMNTQTGEITVKTSKEITVDASIAGKVVLKGLNIELDTPGILGGPYFVMGISAAGVPTHIGSNTGGTVIWVDNPATGVKGAVLP